MDLALVAAGHNLEEAGISRRAAFDEWLSAPIGREAAAEAALLEYLGISA